MNHPCSHYAHLRAPVARTLLHRQVVGLGMLGKEGSGRLRIVAKQQKMKLSAKAAKKAKAYGGASTTSGLQTSGLTTSLAFTPVQVRVRRAAVCAAHVLWLLHAPLPAVGLRGTDRCYQVNTARSAVLLLTWF